MPLRFGPLALATAATLAAALAAPGDARACGGCFHPENQPETTVVTGHRMAFSVSPTQTVLWDQIKYAGSPADFAWVLPVKPGARLEVASDAWFEALDAATATRVLAPQLNCVFNGGTDVATSSGCGCGSVGRSFDGAPESDGVSGGEAPPPPVSVVHEGSVGPYETVTVHANVQGALAGWLKDHGYAIDADIQPIVDSYSAEGFDFIALRLKPSAGVAQMTPVRVVSPGASAALPLRMVAAGTGASVDLTLFVIGEGRWEPANFPAATVDAKDISWDFQAGASDYAEDRKQALAAASGRTWLSTYAKRGPLLSAVNNPVTGGPVQYAVSSSSGFAAPATTIGQSYVLQAIANDEAQSDACTAAFASYAASAGIVVDLCSHPDSGGSGAGGSGAGGGDSATCGSAQIGQIDARALACGKLDDLAVALTGMHPRDVWLTRLEAALPRAALKDDLTLQAAALQADVENWKQAGAFTNPPCQVAGGAAPPGAPAGRGEDPRGPFGAIEGPGHRARAEAAFFAATLTALAAMMARRARRPLPVRSAR